MLTLHEYVAKTKQPDIIQIERMILRGCCDFEDAFDSACSFGHVDIIHYLIKTRNVDKNRGLSAATENGRLEIVKLLVERGAICFSYAIHRACGKGYFEVFDFLKQIDDRVIQWDQCVNYAVNEGKWEFILLYYPYFATNILVWNLRTICKSGNIFLVQLCIKKGGCDWNCGLREACRIGNLEIAKLMLENGADELQEAFLLSCTQNSLELVRLLQGKIGRGWDGGMYGVTTMEIGVADFEFPLGLACKNGMTSIIDFLIEQGTENWNVGLRGACMGGHFTIAQRMIELGATKLSDAIVYACRSRNTELIDYLLMKGATSFDDCLIEACAQEDAVLANKMLNKGAEFHYYIRNIKDLGLYKRHVKEFGGINLKHYATLVAFQDPIYWIVIMWYDNTENTLIRMIPIDLWRCVHELLQ